MAADTLEEGEWSIAASALTVKVSSGEQMIAMTFGPEQRRLMQQALETSVGRSLRLSVTPGAAKKRRAPRGIAVSRSGKRARQGGATSRGAANDGKIRRASCAPCSTAINRKNQEL